MKIKCPNCSSSYKIDSSKLSTKGAYAKCSKCANIFFVRKKTESEVAEARKKLESKKREQAKAVTTAQKTTEIKDNDAVAEIQSDPGLPETESADQQAVEQQIDENEISRAEVAQDEEAPDGAEKEARDVTSEESSQIVPETTLGTGEEAQSIAQTRTVEQAPIEHESADSQDDIDALLAANAPPKEPEPPATAEPESADSQDDIDALLAANAPPKEPELPATAEPESADSQDDIDALLAENAPSDKDETPAAADSQDDIDALLAANAPPQEPEPPATDKPESADSQDDIDALLAENAPSDKDETPAAADSQDDIDALLAENAPPKEEEISAPATADGEPEAVVSQDEIDALVDSNASKSDIDDESLIEQEESDIISQDDIDALLSTGEIEDEDEEKPDQDGEEELEIDIEDADEDELEKLLGDDDEDSGEDLFDEEAGEETPSDEDQTLDELIADGEAGDEEDEEEAMLGIPSEQADAKEEDVEPDRPDKPDEPIIPEEVAESKKAAPASFFEKIKEKILILAGPFLKKIPGVSKLAFPRKLPKVSAMIIGSAVALVLALGAGGYWFFYGSSPQQKTVMKVEDEVKNIKAEPDKMDDQALIDDSLVASEDDIKEPEVNLGIFYPVEFDAEISRVMNVDVDLVFENSQQRDQILGRTFYSIVTVENAIGEFFKDKFFQDTMFVQEKLELYLNKELKKAEGLEGLKLVRLGNLTFEEN